MMLRFHDTDLSDVEALLCDADGNLFPSEEPAFVASADVTNDLLAANGIDRRYSASELRLATTGKNFRTTAVDLLAAAGIPFETSTPAAAAGDAAGADAARVFGAAELERWVEREKREVTAHLGRTLRPAPDVVEPLRAAGERFLLAAVSSSALARLDACFEMTGLAALIPPELRFSAEDSLPRPTSKPDPAIYRFAGEQLGLGPSQALAIEDSIPGAQSAVAAGFPTVGNVQFVPPSERDERIVLLRDAGVLAVVSSWRELDELLGDARGRPALQGQRGA
jgi:beta-phosphoglucomutase-like phosphatase (HAD superfamily)